MTRKSFVISLLAFAALVAAAKPDAGELFRQAKASDDAGDFASATELYLKADSAFTAEGKQLTAEFAQSLHNTGRAFLNSGSFEQGRDYTLRAADLRAKLFGRQSREYTTSLNNYGLAYLLEGKADMALEPLTQVVELCRQMNPANPDEGMYLINLGRVHHALGNESEAVALYEAALPKVEKFSTNYEHILNFLGMVYMERNDNANANRILGLMDEHNRHELTKECNDPGCHLDRAEYYMSTGDPAKAKDEFQAVFAMQLTKPERLLAYTKYARFLSSERDFAQAGEYYTLAAEAELDAHGQTEDATFLRRQAGLSYFIGHQYDKAVEAHRAVIADVDKYGYDPNLKATSLQGLGNALSAKKMYAEAADAFRSWVRHLEDNGQTGEEDYAKAFERLASAEKFNRDYDAAIRDYEKAIELYGHLNIYDKQEQARSGLTLCLANAGQTIGETAENTAAARQREEKLRETLTSSLNTLEQGGDYLGKLSAAQTLATIAGCYAQLEDFDNAILYYSRYIPAIREAIAQDFLLKSPAERELTWKQELFNISELNDLLAALPQNPDLYAKLSNLVYEGQLLSKGILLSSNVEFEKVIRKHGSDDMLRKYAEIKDNTARIEQLKQQKAPLDEILRLTRETDAMQLALARESADYADFMSYLRISADEILKALPADGVAIEFLTLDTDALSDNDIIVAVILSHDYPTGMAVPVAYVKDINRIISSPDRFANNEFGQKIWGAILQSVPTAKNIYFAPEGLLNNIGIEYLSLNGRPLSDQYNVTRLSSTRELARKTPVQPLLYASLFGDIDYIGEGEAASDKRKYAKKRGNEIKEGVALGDLAHTAREIAEIERILRKHTKETKRYTGTKASKAEFLSQQEIDLGLLHIATHGVYLNEKDADPMTRSLLAFAGANMFDDLIDNDGTVKAAEIAEMDLQDCQLVVLSACESGLGKLGSDGVFGLQRGFKNAGVKSMLVSLNEVSDVVTADLMIEFYRALFATPGETMTGALRKAQATIRANYPDDDTWASFILIDPIN